MRRPAVVFLLLLVGAAACSKGKRSASDTTGPAVTAAAFLGAGATPVAGDTLRLFCNETVALGAGALLTDADVTLPTGATLGAVTAAPTLLDSRTVAVVLGAGVNLSPGVTTLTLSANNDVILDSAGNRGAAGTAVVITRGDGDAPTIGLFTANGIDATLNGQGAAGGTLQVPTASFTLDLAYADVTSTVVATANEITADVTVRDGGQDVAAGTNLVPRMTAAVATDTRASYSLAGLSFPTGNVTLTAFVRDTTGRTSAAATLALQTTQLDDSRRPFETGANSSQVWFLDTSRDLESYSLTPGAGTTFRVNATAGANGRADLLDAFALIGLLGPDSAVNDAVVARMQAAILLELLRYFGGANVTFTFTSPGSFPPSASVAYASLGFSQICIAGAPTQAGVLGLALYDPNNETQNNDCLPDFQSTRLGVFVVTVLDNTNGLGGPSTTLFRQTYDALRPEVGGTAIGGDGQDLARLNGAVTDARATTIANAIGRMARFIAVVVAHETGHSMGLVKNGAMPTGLFGGDATNFPGSNSEHIRMPTTVFPAGSVNIMSPTLNFELAQSSSTAFNSLNLAYLRERVLYNR